jgi:hypothetical protein
VSAIKKSPRLSNGGEGFPTEDKERNAQAWTATLNDFAGRLKLKCLAAVPVL